MLLLIDIAYRSRQVDGIRWHLHVPATPTFRSCIISCNRTRSLSTVCFVSRVLFGRLGHYASILFTATGASVGFAMAHRLAMLFRLGRPLTDFINLPARRLSDRTHTLLQCVQIHCSRIDGFLTTHSPDRPDGSKRFTPCSRPLAPPGGNKPVITSHRGRDTYTHAFLAT
jgi:hypothetical protein